MISSQQGGGGGGPSGEGGCIFFSVVHISSWYSILSRPSGESTMSKLFNKASIKRKDVEHLWSFSKDALKKPLLKKTINRDDIRKLACHCFTYILYTSILHARVNKRSLVEKS
ncbi:myosin-VIIa-like protein 2 [Elysia marginata]|uniref:Myosin-VIIa-like protein 2 n=1 Tax=Elysia marginata TaxID=1093978 RepID=A0AAV4HJ63_9GAST|nr:myosin-VIIa-like protein 2 [Elysia marginata]